MRITHWVAVLPLALASCAGPQRAPSGELVAARAAYVRAENSPAQTDAPQALVDARRSLDNAERAHIDSPRSATERHLAIVAMQRSELAIAKANTVAAERNVAQTRQELDRTADEAAQAAQVAQQNAEQARSELARLQQELAQTHQALINAGAVNNAETQQLRDREAALQKQVDQLTAANQQAQQQTAEAQTERDQALQTLQTLGGVTKDAYGSLVLTLPSEVLFRTGSATLRENAKEKLDEIATALTKLGTDQQFVIEGYTDSRGTAAYNRGLSKRRANAVRAYLMSQGVDGDRIVAEGKGESSPVASNRDAEGRAENRRVEIVVTPPAVSRR